MKQFFIIVAAILSSAAIIALVVGVYQAKVSNDKFNDETRALNAQSQSEVDQMERENAEREKQYKTIDTPLTNAPGTGT